MNPKQILPLINKYKMLLQRYVFFIMAIWSSDVTAYHIDDASCGSHVDSQTIQKSIAILEAASPAYKKVPGYGFKAPHINVWFHAAVKENDTDDVASESLARQQLVIMKVECMFFAD